MLKALGAVSLPPALQQRLPDGEWESLIDVARHRQWVVYAGQRVPVLSLEYEAGAYLRLGRLEKAQLLRAWLDRQEGDT